MENIMSYISSFGIIPAIIFGVLGLILGWLFWGRSKNVGDLSLEGEGQLRGEADSLRARINELEGNLSARDTEVSGLKSSLSAAGKGAGAGSVATKAAANDDDETYALEWRNRYLAARVKYLEGRVADGGTKKKAPGKKKAAAKKTVGAKKAVAKKSVAKKAVTKKAVAKKAVAKRAAPKKTGATKAASRKAAPKKAVAKKSVKTKILYDSPTAGKPDDLKQISGVGPKLEKALNKTGVYYFPQIANWNKGDAKMVNDKLGSFPGRIERDDWVGQAKGLAKGTASAKKAAPKKSATKKSVTKKSATKKAAPKKAAPKKAKAKPAAKKATPAKKSTANANNKYYAKIQKYDAGASKTVIDNIVKYCGPSLKSRDASLIACSDEAELNRVAKGFCTKKLGMTSGQKELVAKTCQQMKADRMKNRAVFYYLAAKSEGKLGLFK